MSIPKKLKVFFCAVCIHLFAISSVYCQKPPRPVKFEKISDLAFGTFTYTGTGTVSVSTNGTVIPGVNIIHLGGTVLPLVFTVSNGRPGTRVNLTLNPLIMRGLVHGDEISLDFGPSDPGFSFVFQSESPITLKIGGEIMVPSGVRGDTYRAEFIVIYNQD